jgi:hypothetical protein
MIIAAAHASACVFSATSGGLRRATSGGGYGAGVQSATAEDATLG